MALPIHAAPTFRCKLPSTGKEILYRPYTVREEKILLIALQGTNEKEITDAITQVVKNCIMTEGIDVENMPIYDFEYLMLKIRSQSAEDKISIKFKGRDSECEHCRKEKIVEIDLTTVEVEKVAGHTNKIMLRDDLGVMMHHPTVKDSAKYALGTNAAEKLDILLELAIDCLDNIFDSDKVYPAKEHTREELKDFMEGLTQKQKQKIEQFFDTIPVVKKTLDLSCKHCGYEEFYTLQRLHDFFE
jgi:predicted nucleic-acid-binding Zn-ribbon protein